MTRVKVLYIAGWARSGSTFLDTLLGEIDGFFSAGELRSIWERGLGRGWQCGCKKPVGECEVWSSVLERAYGELNPSPLDDPARIWALQQSHVRLRHLPRLLRLQKKSARLPAELREYVGIQDRLYRSIAEVTGARVVVDSSKLPQDAAVLRLLPNVDAYLIHLVRDPRGVARSMQREMLMQESETDPVEMPRSRPAESAAGWIRANVAGEVMRRNYGAARSATIRYESLVASPTTTLRAIARMVGEPFDGVDLIDDRVITLKGNHTVWGNPSRFKTGAIEIRNDDVWKRDLPTRDRLVSTAMSLPLLARYGYPLGKGRG